MKENHITNSFLLVINHNRKLLQAFLSEFDIPLKKKEVNLLSQVTPKALDKRSSIPDGYIYTDDYGFCIGIETKIEPNSLDREQINSHLEQLRSYDISYLIVLTPDEATPQVITELNERFKNIIFISWQDLLNFFLEKGADKGKNPVGKYLFDEFINYMERNYLLTPFMGFNFNEGYDSELASHYVKRVSSIITPTIQKIYPDCINRRPQIGSSGGYPWEAWYSSKQVQYSIHPGFSVLPRYLRCVVVVSNGCRKEWKQLKLILSNEKLVGELKKYLNAIYSQAPKGSRSVVSFRQRHYKGRTTAISDAETTIGLSTLLGKSGSKANNVWWDLLRQVAESKKKYNYQLEIGYNMEYDKVSGLKSEKASALMIKCFKNLKPLYDNLSIP